MEGLKVYYRGVEVPEGLWHLEEVFEGRLDDWRQGVDAALGVKEEAPRLRIIVDGEGDEWVEKSPDVFSCTIVPGSAKYTEERIRNVFGIREVRYQ